jgi:hypothetical protein
VVAKLAVDAVPIRLKDVVAKLAVDAVPIRLKDVVAKLAVDAVPIRLKEVVANETEEIPVNPLPLPTKLVAVTIPVTLIPLGLILSIDEPEETTVNCPRPR